MKPLPAARHRPRGLASRLCALVLWGATIAAQAQPVPAVDPVLAQPQHAAALRQLARQAALGVGLREPPLPPDAAPSPSAPQRVPTVQELGVGKSRAQLHHERETRDAELRAKIGREALKGNQEAVTRLTDLHTEMTQRCGQPLPEWPALGMGIAQINCTVSMRFADITQDLLLEQGGHRYQLWVMRGSPLRRVWLLDLRVVRIDTQTPPAPTLSNP
jgi:hypothetical protein